MTVFKAFWQVVNKYKGVVLLYTIILTVFGGINTSTNEEQTTFVASRPDVLIVNDDEEIGLTKNLIDYIKNNANIIDIETDEEKINDALFYRDVNYVIYIPANYRNDVLSGKNPVINIKSTKDYNASLTELMLKQYIKVQNIYTDVDISETEMINKINNVLNNSVAIEMTSKVDTSKTSKATSYFNFASYSIMAVVIFVVCLVISSFHSKPLIKRMTVSSMNYKKINLYILLSSFIYSLIVWLLFIILGIVLVGDIMFTTRGLIYMLNLLVFTFCSLTIALLISTVVYNKDAVGGIVNVIALGSAFLCGAFVPAEMLPTSVLKIAQILPAYWYINTNDLLKTMEVFDYNSLLPIIINIVVLLLFAVIFIFANNYITKKKRKLD